MLPTIIETIVRVLTENLPKIIEAGITVLIALINRNNRLFTSAY